MLREALRRLLWLGPTLLVVTIPTFWALARATDRAHVAREGELPVFFNADPLGTRERAAAAVATIARGGQKAPAAEHLLAMLGGAAFPHVLSQLDTLPPEARGRVALSLAPVARRMGIASGAEIETPEAAVRFFTRYWQEHSIDFRAPLVHRAVHRLADHPSTLRLREVLEFDTFALEELIDAMHPLETSADVNRARRLCSAASHVAEQPWTIPDAASLAEARLVVAAWDTLWREHRGDYSTFTGTRRLGATVVETRYGRWIEHFVRRGAVTAAGERPFGATLVERGPVTLWLLLSGLLLGYPLALAIAMVTSAHRRGPSDVGLSLVAAAAAAASSVGVSAGLALLFDEKARFVCAVTTMALAGVAAASFHQRATQTQAAELVHLRTELAFGASRARILVRSMRLTLGPAVVLIVADLPALVTAAFVTEHAFALPGLGATTIDALRAGDHAWLMGLALTGTLALGVAQILSDLVLRTLDPRVQSAALRAHGAAR